MPPGGPDGKGEGGRFPEVFEQMGSVGNVTFPIARTDFVSHLSCDNWARRVILERRLQPGDLTTPLWAFAILSRACGEMQELGKSSRYGFAS